MALMTPLPNQCTPGNIVECQQQVEYIIYYAPDNSHWHHITHKVVHKVEYIIYNYKGQINLTRSYIMKYLQIKLKS
jgi:hypothetical protein